MRRITDDAAIEIFVEDTIKEVMQKGEDDQKAPTGKSDKS